MKKFSYLTVDIWCLLPKVGELRTKPLRLPTQEKTVPVRRIPNKKRGQGGGGSSERRIETVVGHVRDRHGLL